MTEAAPGKYIVKVVCLTGFTHHIESQVPLAVLWKFIVADGYLALNVPDAPVCVPYHAIGQMEQVEAVPSGQPILSTAQPAGRA